jgi:hypothetical protein
LPHVTRFGDLGTEVQGKKSLVRSTGICIEESALQRHFSSAPGFRSSNSNC